MGITTVFWQSVSNYGQCITITSQFWGEIRLACLRTVRRKSLLQKQYEISANIICILYR